MDKLQITNTCPDEYRKKQEGIEYPTPQKITYYSKVTESERKMNVILPVGYDENKKYPVVYFLHGLMSDEDGMLGDESTIAIPTNLIKEGKAKEMIMVLPDIYAPVPGTAVEPNYDPEYYKGYDNFINELTEVIMPYMEEHYPILTGRENTAICGFSMGARTSLYIGYMKSDLIGYTGAFAPAPGITPGEDSFSGKHPGLITEDEFRAEIPPIVSLIDCGTNDSVVGQFPKSYHEILTRNGQKHIWFEVPYADHDWNAISAGLYNFLQTTFGVLNN
ncbi:alpha/beta-hydrolase [Anaeromyces robustus]|uniref:Alpha/beta-hydrolase n=1 Tax=Anaeromyces robustus TaxID=1754192 RepID=A0A1Y1XEQ9_9FUNG|nr:alpha/beta-hydrolase [Anaeromyces robustus]|eukprot:ORX84250.1 alpha/beta-hydrolase [Anaeromyces robustus]